MSCGSSGRSKVFSRVKTEDEPSLKRLQVVRNEGIGGEDHGSTADTVNLKPAAASVDVPVTATKVMIGTKWLENKMQDLSAANAEEEKVEEEEAEGDNVEEEVEQQELADANKDIAEVLEDLSSQGVSSTELDLGDDSPLGHFHKVLASRKGRVHLGSRSSPAKKWKPSAGDGVEFLKKEQFTAGLIPTLRLKVESGDPVTYHDAERRAYQKYRKLKCLEEEPLPVLRPREVPIQVSNIAPIPVVPMAVGPSTQPAMIDNEGRGTNSTIAYPSVHVVEVASVRPPAYAEALANGIKRTRGKEKEDTMREDSIPSGREHKREKGETSKRRRRRRINLHDFPLGHGMSPYNLIEDLQAKGPSISWPQFFALCPQVRREMAKAISTRIPKKKGNVVRIAPVEMEDIVPTIDCFIKGTLVQKGLVDGGAQICIMTEATMHRLNLKIHKTPEVRVKMADNSRAKCLGMVRDVRVDALGVKQELDFYIMSSKGNGYPLILGRPWLIKMGAKQDWETGELICERAGKKIVYDMKEKRHEEVSHESTTSESEEDLEDTTSSSEDLSSSSEEGSSVIDVMGIRISHCLALQRAEPRSEPKGEFPPRLTSLQRKRLIKRASSYLWLDGVLYQKGKDLVCRRVPSCKEIPLILKSLHEEACGGHFAHDLTARKILHAGYVWPTLHLDVQHWCRTCHQCQINGDRKLVHGPRHPVVANGPFEKWGIDAIGRLPRTADGKLYILVAIDYMTKWVEAQSVSRVTERTVSKFVYSHICCRFGAPQEIILDHGPGFREGLLTRVCEEMKVKHQHATPYYPQSNGAVEKTNGIITKILRKMVESQEKHWDRFLDGALWAYRTTYKCATGFTPFHLVYDQEALQPIELEIPTIRAIKNEGKTEEEILADECVKWVLLDNKRFLSVETFEQQAMRRKALFDDKVKKKEILKGNLVLRQPPQQPLQGQHNHLRRAQERTDNNKDQDFEGSDKEDSPKGSEAKGPSEHEPSDQEDTSTPLDKKSKKPQFVEQILLDEAMARVEAMKKELADARAAKAAKSTKPTTMEVARKARMEKAKALQEERRRLETEKKAQEEAVAAQAAQTKEKEVVDLSGTIEHLKKIEREKHIEEQRAAQLAR
ncbi:hypothetical protein L7F22_040712 [Adiantum nelumboides]|nr:hypothetical protein [Adiantum nelumboides]